MMRASVKKQSRKDDERNLLHHDPKESTIWKENEHDSSVVISPSSTTTKQRKTPLLFSKNSPVDVRQIDSSFSFQTLEQDEDENGELDMMDDHNVEQTLLAIASFEVSGCNHDEFKDEDEASEYSGTAQFVSSDTLPSYAQFVPGLSPNKSHHEAMPDAIHAPTSIAETILNDETEKDDVEAQVPIQLAQSDNVVGAQIRKELLQQVRVPPSRNPQPQGNGANDSKSTPFKRKQVSFHDIACTILDWNFISYRLYHEIQTATHQRRFRHTQCSILRILCRCHHSSQSRYYSHYRHTNMHGLSEQPSLVGYERFAMPKGTSLGVDVLQLSNITGIFPTTRRTNVVVLYILS